MTREALKAVQAEIVADIRAEAEARGLAWAGRNAARRGSKAAALCSEISTFRMMGTVSLQRWAAKGYTYDTLVSAASEGIIKIQPDRHRRPIAAGLRS